jgi:xyloglucan-specific exo-beta-1,4-glucanase
VPTNLISIPGGPLFSTIKDYDGFRHTDVNQYAPIYNPRMGATEGLAYGGTNNSKIVRTGDTMYYSNDMGLTWNAVGSDKGTDGAVAVSKDGSIILYCPSGSSTTYISNNNGAGWGTVTGLTISDAVPVSDGATNGTYYAYDAATGIFMVSTNGGWSFVAAATILPAGGSKLIRTVPGRAGHVWVALKTGGLRYTQNSGGAFTTVAKVSYCEAVGIGKAATGAAYETIYIYGTVDGVLGIHRSIDKGLNWVRVNDDDHEYGGPANGQYVIGDMNTYGRVYMSTAGRGIVFGSAQNCTPTAITPYTQINGGSWINTGKATVAAGATVKFGPQPVVTATWSWRGPNYLRDSTRELTITNVQAKDTGTYTATYTNSSGCRSSYQFKISLAGGASAARTSIVSANETIPGQEVVKMTTYPNPVKNTLTINLHKTFVGGNIIMTNAGGAIVYGGRIMQSKNVIDMSYMPVGLYIVTIKNNRKTTSTKVLKK